MASFELKDPREYNRLTPILYQINREVVALQEDQKKRAVAIMNEVVSHVVLELKCVNETFNKVYKDTRWVGSYFDGLRVCEPSEFDVNIVLQFPFHQKCQVEKSVPGFVRVCAEPDKHRAREQGGEWNRRSMDYTLKQFIDEGGYIRQDKVLAWWQSMFSKAINPSDFRCFGGGFYKVTCQLSGPAITLHVVSQEDPVVMDIDLVPVLRFKDTDASSPSTVFDSWLERTGIPYPPKEWYIVPKPLKNVDTNRLWRLSFTDQEKVIMRGKDHLKPVNRLLKRLRDNNDWALLSSYFIKTVVLHESGRDVTFHRSNLGYLLMFFMTQLRNHLYNRRLPFYWDPQMNLFAQIPSDTQLNMCGSLNRILKNIHRFLDDEKELEEYMRSLFIGGVGTRSKQSIRKGQEVMRASSQGGVGGPGGASGSLSQGQQEPSGIGLGTGILLGGLALGVGLVASMAFAGNRNNRK